MKHMIKHDLFDDLLGVLDPLTPLSVRPRAGSYLTMDVGVRRDVTEDELKLNIDLPGVKKEDVEISFESNTLKVLSKRADLQSESTHRCSLSNEWDQDSAEASLEDGVLTLRLKKTERAKPKKLLLK